MPNYYDPYGGGQYDPYTGLPNYAADPSRIADQLWNPRFRPGRISGFGNTMPPRPYTPMGTEEPESIYKRALNAVATPVGQVLGMFYRGAGTAVAGIRGAAEGDPLKYMRLAPGQLQGGLLEDIGGTVGALPPAFETPDPTETVKSGSMATAALASETLGGDPTFFGEELGLGPDGLPLKELTPEERQRWEEANPKKAYTKAVAGAAADIVIPFGLDPLMAVLGAARAPAALGRLGRGLLPVAKAVGPAFIPGLAMGATENLGSAFARAQEEGITPQVVREATTGVAEGLMAAAGAAHGVGALRRRLNRPRVVQGEVVPDAMPPAAPRGLLEAPPIDAEVVGVRPRPFEEGGAGAVPPEAPPPGAPPAGAPPVHLGALEKGWTVEPHPSGRRWVVFDPEGQPADWAETEYGAIRAAEEREAVYNQVLRPRYGDQGYRHLASTLAEIRVRQEAQAGRRAPAAEGGLPPEAPFELPEAPFELPEALPFEPAEAPFELPLETPPPATSGRLAIEAQADKLRAEMAESARRQQGQQGRLRRLMQEAQARAAAEREAQPVEVAEVLPPESEAPIAAPREGPRPTNLADLDSFDASMRQKWGEANWNGVPGRNRAVAEGRYEEWHQDLNEYQGRINAANAWADNPPIDIAASEAPVELAEAPVEAEPLAETEVPIEAEPYAIEAEPYAIEAEPYAIEAEPLAERGPSRRVTPAPEPPGGVPERRLTERRARLAEKHGVPADNPLVEEAAQLEERAEQAEEGRKRAEEERDLDLVTGVASRAAHGRALANDEFGGHASLDLTGLKRVNDKLGHRAGDHYLRQVAQAARPIVERLGGRFFRRGGDEFAIGAKDEAHARDIARAVKDDLLTRPIDAVVDGKVVDTFQGVRVDFGYAGGRGEEGFTAADNYLKAYRDRAEQLPPDHPEYRKPSRPQESVGGGPGGVRDVAPGAPEGSDIAAPPRPGALAPPTPQAQQAAAPEDVGAPPQPSVGGRAAVEARPGPAGAAPPRPLPEPPKDRLGNPILPGQEDWSPERRAASRAAAQLYAQEARDLAKGEKPKKSHPIVGLTPGGQPTVTGIHPGISSGLKGTPLEGLGSPKQILGALEKDRGNKLEMRVLDAVDGSRRAEEIEADIREDQERDAIEPEGEVDTSFLPPPEEEPSFLTPPPAPGPPKPKEPEQGTMFGAEMLQGVESRTTEGREAEGPLFTQEADASARAEAAAQGTLPVEEAAALVDPSPTPAQIEAGNYRMGHTKVHGLDITVTTSKGGTRTAPDGSWEAKHFPAHYGYVKGTEGRDGEQIDVYVGDDLDSQRVWVIDQINPETKAFDEHKVMLGFGHWDYAWGTYMAAMGARNAVDRLGDKTEMSVQQFKAWLANGNTTKPVRYKEPKPKPRRVYNPDGSYYTTTEEPAEEAAPAAPAPAAAPPGRVTVSFPRKPPVAVRTGLKRAGFKWDPDKGAWSAPRTKGALAVLPRVRELGANVEGAEGPPALTFGDIPWSKLSKGERRRAEELLASNMAGTITAAEQRELDNIRGAAVANEAPPEPEEERPQTPEEQGFTVGGFINTKPTAAPEASGPRFSGTVYPISPKGRKPWQMSLDEFAWRHEVSHGRAGKGQPIPEEIIRLHETTLRNAIEVGLPVPAELRDQYPALAGLGPDPERAAAYEAAKAEMARVMAERAKMPRRDRNPYRGLPRWYLEREREHLEVMAAKGDTHSKKRIERGELDQINAAIAEPLRVGERVKADEGVGQVARISESGTDLKIALEPEGYLTKWIPASRVDREPRPLPAGATIEPDVDPDLQAEPPHGPAAADQGPLEGVPSGEVPEPEAAGPAPGAPGQRLPSDKGRLPRPDRQGPGARPGVGAREGGVGVSTPRAEEAPEASPAVQDQRDVEAVADVETAAGNPEAAAEVRHAGSIKSRGRDYKIDAERLGTGGPKAKFQANIGAIKALKAIEAEGRLATLDEQEALVQYIGWGMFPQLFNPNVSYEVYREWQSERRELEGLLSTEELAAAKASTTNAHYTSVPVVKAMWEAVQRLGVGRHARILEPAMGIGHFFGLQPSATLPASRTGVELDPITGGISKLLYPNANVVVKALQRTQLPPDHYDLVISNVPFANITIHDPEFRKNPYVLQSLHDYYFAKGLSLVRPGGLVAFITSHYTMDKQDPRVREYIAQRANLVGAIRLPNSAFKANAGTQVVTDILFLRRLLQGEQPSGEDWTGTTELAMDTKTGEKVKHHVNNYFLANPRMALGAHSAKGSQYGPAEYTLEGDVTPEAMAKAIELLPEDVVRSSARVEAPGPVVVAAAEGEGKQGSYSIHEGQIVVRKGEQLVSAQVSKADDPRIRGMIQIRDAARAVLDAQITDQSEAKVKAAQKELGRVYDAFTKKHGALNARANKKAFDEDPEAQLLLGLEDWDSETNKATKRDIFTKRTLPSGKRAERADSALSALTISLNETGRVDWPTMERLTSKDRQALQDELAGRVFLNPQGHNWETAEEYLSGDVRQKFKFAKAAAATDSAYDPNVAALEAAQPEDLKPGDIHVRLGSPWIPVSVIEDFVRHVLDIPIYRGGDLSVAHTAELGLWALSVPNTGKFGVLATEKWGTKRVPAGELIEAALNLRQPTVIDRFNDGTSVVNQDETLAAREKLQALNEEIATWIWADSGRAEKMVRRYNDLMNAIRNRTHDGSHLTLPGMSRTGLRGDNLDPHQLNAAWRIIQATPRTNVLLNHAVGAGKTNALIAGIMERIRVGVTSKAAVVVPKHLTNQWGEAFAVRYPKGRVLVVQQKHTTPQGREALMARIATGNYDAVVMSFQAFEKLPVRQATYKKFMEEQLAEYEMAIMAMKKGKADTRLIKKLEKLKAALQERIDKLLSLHAKDAAVTFEDLGFDLVAVDEAHAYKALPTPSKMQLLGISKRTSNRAMDMYMKARRLNEAGGVLVFATGTPITNTMGESFVLQKFLQPELLRERGLQHFDSWAANFGDVRTTVELDATGTWKPRSRFAQFVNVSDLSTMMSETMDTKLAEDLGLPVPKYEVVRHVAPGSGALKRYIADLAERAKNVKSGSVLPTQDNYLKITTDGRKAATDMRLVDRNQPDDPDSKINLAVKTIFEQWKEGTPRRTTQIVFLDLSVPKEKKAAKEAAPEDEEEDEEAAAEAEAEEAENVGLYEDIRDKLIAKGIPKEEIAFIHDVKTDDQKKRLSKAVNDGRTRILMGSTMKMGTGMNVQAKLSDMHLIAPPNRPDEVEQAEGRIIRQGNEHYTLKLPVRIHRYATEGSYDTVLWGMLDRKARFIKDFLHGASGVRKIEDTGVAELSYAQMMAVSSGDQRIAQKVANDAEVEKLTRLERAHKNAQYELKARKGRLESRIASGERYVSRLEEDLAKYKKAKAASKDFSMKVGKKTYTDREEAGTALLEAAVKIKASEPREIGEYLGFPLTVHLRDAIGDKNKKEPVLNVGAYQANMSGDAEGTVSSVAYQLRDLESKLEGERGEVARLKKELGHLAAEEGKPFKQADALAKAKKAQEELDAALNPKVVDAVVPDDGPEAEGPGGGEPPKKPPKAGAGPEYPDDEEGGLAGAANRARGRLRKRGRGNKANDLGSAAAEGAGAFKDLGIIGADWIARGFRRFGAWAKRMLADVGGLVQGLRRALRRIWEDARNIFRGMAGKERTPRAAREGAKPAAEAPPAKAPRPPKVEPPKPGESVEDVLRRTAAAASERARKVHETFDALREKYERARRHAETIREEGTLPKEEREAFRREGQPSREQTKGFRFSEADIEAAGAELVDAVRQFEKAKAAFDRSADPASAENMRVAERVMKDAVKAWQVYRSAAGRAVHRFSEPIPDNLIHRLREAGVMADFARLAKERVPIATNIIESLKRWKELTSAEKTQFGKDLIDHFRLNLFSVSSWTLDIIGNAAELSAQAAGGVARDLVHMAKGNPTFPSMQGLLRAIRYRAKNRFQPLGGGLEEMLGHSIGGERIGTAPTQGRFGVPRQKIFTRRGNLASTIYDYVVGGPLYMKGVMDTAAKRLGATWQVFREAIEAADQQGLKGAERQRFVDDFVENIPEDTARRAAERARKAGYDRDLSKLEERFANSTTAKLLVDSFARWPFQFTRWAAEMLGYNRELFSKFVRGKAGAEEIAEYLGKTATGWGGLLLLNQLYDNVDFNSMEYVDEDGNRIRLSNRDPIPSGLWFLSLIRGDLDRAVAGLPFASVPFGRLLSAEGGLVGGTVVKFQQAAENPQNAPRALRREVEGLLNRAIPGQALLSAMETVFDPTIRQGVGANVPLVSSMLPAAIDPTTGEELRPRQRVLGVELPAIGGTPIPGATRLLTPVHKLLSRYGLLTYRGPRQPVAGYPSGQMPDELQQEWTKLFGYYRNRLLGPMADQLDRLEGLDAERVRKEVQRRDSLAAKYASRHLSRQAGRTIKPARQPTARERRGPVAWT